MDYLSSKYLEKPSKKKAKKSKKASKKNSTRDWFGRPSGSAKTRGDGYADDDSDFRNSVPSVEEGEESDEGPVVVEGVEDGLSPTDGGLKVVEAADHGGGPKSRRRRRDYDSSSDVEPTARKVAVGSVGRRRRYDSDDEVEPGRQQAQGTRPDHRRSGSPVSSDNRASPRETQKKRRYDSENDINDHEPKGRRKRSGDSDTLSDGESSKSSSRRDERGRRRRFDSWSDNEKDARHGKSPSGRTIRDSRRYDSDDDDDDRHSSGGAERMSSGHRAGLQTAHTFAEREAALTHRRRAEAQAALDQHGAGETVYRRDTARAGAAAPPQPQRSGPTAAEAVILNTGRVQREAEANRLQRMEEMGQSPFARHADDERLEELRKSAVREGDPMAATATTSTSRAAAPHGAETQRPVYKGPPAKPNRFSIRPGYRWDGVDRGNGFEDRLLGQQYSKQQQKEQAYRLSSMDM